MALLFQIISNLKTHHLAGEEQNTNISTTTHEKKSHKITLLPCLNGLTAAPRCRGAPPHRRTRLASIAPSWRRAVARRPRRARWPYGSTGIPSKKVGLGMGLESFRGYDFIPNLRRHCTWALGQPHTCLNPEATHELGHTAKTVRWSISFLPEGALGALPSSIHTYSLTHSQWVCFQSTPLQRCRVLPLWFLRPVQIPFGHGFPKLPVGLGFPSRRPAVLLLVVAPPTRGRTLLLLSPPRSWRTAQRACMVSWLANGPRSIWIHNSCGNSGGISASSSTIIGAISAIMCYPWR